MGRTFMPSQKAAQVAWSDAFIQAVVAATPAAYGLPTAAFTNFQGINADLQVAWAASQNEATRTKLTIRDRDALLAQMKAAAGKLVSIIQGTAAVTPTMLIAAGLTVRSDKPKPRPVPVVAHYVIVTGVIGRTVTIELRQDAHKRGRPAQVASAGVFAAPAGTALTDLAAWTYYGNFNKTTVDVTFPDSPTGDTVMIAAFWSNSRSENGPMSTPVSVNLPASVQKPVIGKMKLAA